MLLCWNMPSPKTCNPFREERLCILSPLYNSQWRHPSCSDRNSNVRGKRRLLQTSRRQPVQSHRLRLLFRCLQLQSGIWQVPPSNWHCKGPYQSVDCNRSMRLRVHWCLRDSLPWQLWNLLFYRIGGYLYPTIPWRLRGIPYPYRDRWC